MLLWFFLKVIIINLNPIQFSDFILNQYIYDLRLSDLSELHYFLPIEK